MTRGAGISDRGLRRIPNPADLTALEQALLLKKVNGATVTVLTIGPGRLDDLLRLALAMGADRAIRCHDHGVEGGDAVADARILARLVEILSPTLFFSGNRLADRGDDPVPALAAALRNTPCLAAVTSFILTAGGVTVQRKSDRGGRQKMQAGLPAVILFEEAPLSSYPDVVAVTSALQAAVEKWDLADLGIPVWEVGPTGSALPLASFGTPRHDPVRVVTPDASLPAFQRIVSLLSGGIKAREGKQYSLDADAATERLWQILLEEGVAS
jgi:electron transfer flavoprotein beta subunit